MRARTRHLYVTPAGGTRRSGLRGPSGGPSDSSRRGALINVVPPTVYDGSS